MRSCDSRCLFSGSKGEVCSIEPLHAPADFRDHPITHYSLLAMASLTKVSRTTAQPPRPRDLLPRFHHVFLHQILVIGLKPSLKVWITCPYTKVCIYMYLITPAQVLTCLGPSSISRIPPAFLSWPGSSSQSREPSTLSWPFPKETPSTSSWYRLQRLAKKHSSTLISPL